MTHYIGLDVSQKLRSICIVDDIGRRLWRGQPASDPEQIERAACRRRCPIGVETGPKAPWLVQELRGRRLDATCPDAKHAPAALKIQINKIDQNDAEGLAQIMRTDEINLCISSRSGYPNTETCLPARGCTMRQWCL